jgi:4-aminobutyrate aminotransferase/(S)-3-amino-2-methylpropionate transaminase
MTPFPSGLTAADVPQIRTAIPGPRSRALRHREDRHRSPGTSAPAGLSGLAMRDGLGCLVRDVDDNIFLDFAAGAGAALTGHAHPAVTERLRVELSDLLHIYDYTTRSRTEFFERLADLLAEQGLDHFQMYSGGTETVEAVLRLASAHAGRAGFVSLQRGFHGKTLASDALGARRSGGAGVGGFHQTPNAYCYRCPLKLSYPSCGVACADVVESVVDQTAAGQVAAVVVEPVQGAGGVIVPPAGFLEKIQSFCRARGILFIVDEVLTAPGRTGRWLAAEHFGLRADLMTLSKGLGSGFPLGVVAGRAEIVNGPRTAPYGSATTTFGGSPIAAAAGLVTLEVLAKENLVANAEKVGRQMLDRLERMRAVHPSIGQVRGLGLLIGIEFVRDRETREPISLAEADVLYLEIIRHGLLVASAGPVVRLTPALVITQELADRGLDLLEESITVFERTIRVG